MVSDGPSRVATIADLRGYITFIRSYVKDVQDAKRSGKSVDDVAASWKPPAGYGAQPARKNPAAERSKTLSGAADWQYTALNHYVW